MTADDEPHGVRVHLDRLLAERDMTLTELGDRIGITLANLSILKNQRARAIRFSTLAKICGARLPARGSAQLRGTGRVARPSSSAARSGGRTS